MILRSFVTKIIISTTFILFIAIGVSWWIHMRIYENQLMDELRGKVETVLDTAESSISKSMRIGKTDDTQNILELVNSHMREDSVVRIFHPDGVIIKSTDVRETGKMISGEIIDAFRDGQTEIILFDNSDERALSMTKPIKNISECHMCHGESSNSIGILEAQVSLSMTDEKLGEARTLSNLSAVVISLILSLFILLMLYWIVIKPISKLSRKMILASRGDLTVRSGLAKGDEIGDLGRSFDAMITKLHKARSELEKYHFQQMERADRLASVGELASGIAHEIKNPLAGIAGAVQVLVREFRGDKRKEQVVTEILQQINRLDKSVKDLLNYASPSMPKFEMCDLNNIVEKALFFVTQQPNARGIKVVKAFDNALPKIRLDDKQIQQVLLNLFLNALNAMEGEGVLKIFTGLEDRSMAIIKVEDDGKGISAEDIASLYVPFYTTRDEGTGLGLAISKRIVEQHGGSIQIESTIGEGTSIWVKLPLEGPQ